MTDTLITCPQCHAEIPLTEALTARLHAQFDAAHQATLARAVAEAEARARADAGGQLTAIQQELAQTAEKARATEARELALRRQALEAEQAKELAVEAARIELEQKLRRESSTREQVLLAQAAQKARTDADSERKRMGTTLAEERKQRERAEQAELTLRKEKSALEERERGLELEVARKVDAEKALIEASVRKTSAEEQALKLKEKEKQIEDLRNALADAKRKSEQGSQELQGEVLELDVQAVLERQFPHDLVKPVSKGVRGADLLHEVRNVALQTCGSIVWETKNTKNWSAAWIEKLKEDQRAAGANLAVLVSLALPDDIKEFGQIDGVWIASLRVWPALACVLREQLLQVAFAHAASEGKQEKMDLMYRYLAGDQFRGRVQGIVEAFTELQEQINRERRAMERIWKEREKQIERVVVNTVGMYGEMRGLIGQTMPGIEGLELVPAALLDSISGDQQ